MDLRFLVGMGAVLIFILMVAYFFYGLQPSEVSAAAVQFKIARGEGLKAISAHLSQTFLIKSISVFKFYSLMSGKAQKFQPGIYELTPRMSVPQIVGILTESGRNEITVVLPEGLALKDFDKILSDAQVVETRALANYPFKALANEYPFLAEATSLEGFIFPDTYRFHIDSTPEEVLKRILENFKLKAWPLLAEKENWYDYLVLASFLEREVPDFNDRQIVAGLLWKRLKNSTPLQIDATISYLKCGGELKDCDKILVTKKDLAFPSTYNTYQRLGLTPTPIANPGQAAIKAALTPKISSYWYYLSDSKTKETIFARTLEEHNQNRFKYL